MCEKYYLCGKVIAELELLEEGGQKDGWKEENDAPEEDIRYVGAFRAAGAAHKLSALLNTVLQIEGQNHSYSLYN